MSDTVWELRFNIQILLSYLYIVGTTEFHWDNKVISEGHTLSTIWAVPEGAVTNNENKNIN